MRFERPMLGFEKSTRLQFAIIAVGPADWP
jgi:hypothetical protein